MAQGVQYLPIRYPREAPSWFVSFMDTFIKDVLTNADVRNAVPGNGIEITGQPDQPATISNGADVQQLIDENYILAEPSTFLVNGRVLTGEPGVVSITDAGPSGNFTIGLYDGGLPWSKLGEIDELSVLGNPTAAFGEVSRITGAAQHEVLSIQLNGGNLEVRFGTVTHQSVSDFDEAAQDAVGTILVDGQTINFTYTDGTPAITAEAITQMSVTADASGLKLVNDAASPGNSQVYGTGVTGVKGWYPAGGVGGSSSLSIGTITTLSGATLNLTTEGTYDWFGLFGSTSWTEILSRKRNGLMHRKYIAFTGGTATAGALTGWGFASAPTYSAVDNAYASGSGSQTNGSFRSCNVNESLFISFEAGPVVARTVVVYLSNATPYAIYATLSDGTTASQTGITTGNARVPITYTPGSAGLSLLIEIRKESSTGNIGLSAVTVA